MSLELFREGQRRIGVYPDSVITVEEADPTIEMEPGKDVAETAIGMFMWNLRDHADAGDIEAAQFLARLAWLEDEHENIFESFREDRHHRGMSIYGLITDVTTEEGLGYVYLEPPGPHCSDWEAVAGPGAGTPTPHDPARGDVRIEAPQVSYSSERPAMAKVVMRQAENDFNDADDGCGTAVLVSASQAARARAAAKTKRVPRALRARVAFRGPPVRRQQGPREDLSARPAGARGRSPRMRSGRKCTRALTTRRCWSAHSRTPARSSTHPIQSAAVHRQSRRARAHPSAAAGTGPQPQDGAPGQERGARQQGPRAHNPL